MLGLEAVGLVVKILVILFFTSSIPPVDDIDREVGRLRRKWNNKYSYQKFYIQGFLFFFEERGDIYRHKSGK